MKYYQMHEQVYKGLKDSGFISWDKERDLDKIWQHQINQSLKHFLARQSLQLKDLNVLDLGTGAGTCALFCAKEGAKCVGVDISKTAIEMARANNQFLKLDAEFLEEDIINLKLDKKFDLITDSSLLHCLVGQEDRTKFYEVVKTHLSEKGMCFIHTMTASEDMGSLLGNDYTHLEGEVLYSLGIKDIKNGRSLFNGKSYFPHRTLLRLDNLLLEIASADFEVLCSSVISSKGEPDNFIALISRK